MNDLHAPAPTAEPISADKLPTFLYTQPTRSSHDGGWCSLTAHHFLEYRCEGGFVLPTLREDMVLVHIKEPVPLQRRRNDEHDQGMSRPGELTIQPRGQASRWQWTGSPEMLSLHPQPCAMQEICATLSEQDPTSVTLLPRFAAQDALLHQLAIGLLDELQDGSPFGSMYAEALAQAFMARLLRRHSTLVDGYRAVQGGLDERRLRRALEFINTNLALDLSITQIAQAVHLSAYHFARSFKASTGRAPHVFVVERRIEHAKRLLVSTKLPIADVCESCGFQSQSHFSVVFRRMTGLPPTAFRASG
jgi:AraC family transcriptional regulator